MIYTHVLDKGPGGVQSPATKLATLPEPDPLETIDADSNEDVQS